MTIDEFLEKIDKKQPPAPEPLTEAFERAIGDRLPEDYRDFLIRSNGGYVGGKRWFKGPTPEGRSADAGVHHIGGFRHEGCFSLERHRVVYQVTNDWIPRDLIWIMDDPFGNAICLGVSGEYRGRVYFWDHERIPAKGGREGHADATANLKLLANTFAEFVAGLQDLRKNK
jgi:hypothetical protein